MSLSPYNERADGIYTLGDVSDSEVVSGVAWSIILKGSYNVYARKKAFAHMCVISSNLNILTACQEDAVFLCDGHPVDVHIGKTRATVDMHETWSQNANIYCRRYEVVMYKQSGGTTIATATGNVAGRVTKILVRYQPLIHAAIVPIGSIATYALAPGMQLWARHVSAAAMQVVPFHYANGYLCGACGTWHHTLQKALDHTNGGTEAQYTCVKTNACFTTRKPGKVRAAKASAYSLPVNSSTLRRKLAAIR
tara:strand:+ start:157 stop:909 length:753 start_codon:yes stop_codon:yes gene_type:complete